MVGRGPQGQLNPPYIVADASYMLALSIRQPYAEQIMRGIKTIEYRSKPTNIIGKRFYIYASKKWAGAPTISGHAAPGCSDMKEGDAPTGVIVGSAVISHVTMDANGQYEWHLKDVRRFKTPRKVKRQPQPVWFRPW